MARGVCFVYVTPYAPRLGVESDGWSPGSGETVAFGTSNKALARTFNI